MVESSSRVADKVFQCSSCQISRHDFPLGVRSKCSRITDFTTQFNARYRGLQIVRVRQRVGFDSNRVVSVRPRQADTTPALGSYNAPDNVQEPDGGSNLAAVSALHNGTST